MEEILQKARELAEAIVNSEVYKRSKAAEAAAYADPDATCAVAEYYTAEKAVQALLSQKDMDPQALAEAGRALEAARDTMENNVLVKEMQQANAACNDLISTVSMVLQQAISSAAEGGCSGSCSTCGGCGRH